MQERILRETQPYIEAAGGHKAINASMEADERAMRHFWENQDYYLKKYPRKYVVFTAEGAAIVGDDLEETLEEALRTIAPGSGFHFQFMDPEPQSWLL